MTPTEFFDELLQSSGTDLKTLAEWAGYEERTLQRVRSGEVKLSQRLRSNLERAARRMAEINLPKVETSGPREKLSTALTKAGMTPFALAKKIGYEPGVIENVVRGTGRASEKMIEAIVSVLPDLSKEELMGGGESLSVIREDGMEAIYGQKPTLSLPPGMKARTLALLTTAEAGAWDAEHSDEGYTDAGWVAFDVPYRRAFAVRVSGKSMEPDLYDGDVVICSPDAEISPGECAVIRTQSGQAFIKFWVPSGDEITLLSANKAFPKLTFPKSEIAGTWPVVQHTSRRSLKTAPAHP